MKLHPASRTWLHRLYLLCVFLFLLLIFWLIPPTHDDWYHEDSQTLFHGLIAHSAAWYRNLNGRILGNALISVTGGHHLLRAVLQSLIVWGIWMTTVRILKMPSWLHHLFLIGLFSLPSALYAQTYGWASGFFSLSFSILAMAKVRAATDWAFRASSSKVAGISLATTLQT